jgi:hypothetical protein
VDGDIEDEYTGKRDRSDLLGTGARLVARSV